jgi:hypothetical protein
VRRDVAHQRRLPPHLEQREAQTGEERQDDHGGQRAGKSEGDRLQWPEHGQQQAHHHRPRRTPANAQHRADHRAAAGHALQHPEAAGAAVYVASDPRREGIPRRVGTKHGAGEGGDRHPHPGPRGDLAPAGAQLLRNGARRGLGPHTPAWTGMHPHQQQRAHHERGRVERERLSGTQPQDQPCAQRGADENRQVGCRGAQRLRLLGIGLGDRLRQQAAVGRLKEGARRAEQRLNHDQLGDTRTAGEDQCRQHAVKQRPRAVAEDHDPLPRGAIGPHAAEQQQRDHRQGLRGQHEAEVARRAGALSHVQGEGDDHNLIADGARRLAEEQISKVRVAQDAQVRTHHNLWTRREAARRLGSERAAAAGDGACQQVGMASIAPISLPRIGPSAKGPRPE